MWTKSQPMLLHIGWKLKSNSTPIIIHFVLKHFQNFVILRGKNFQLDQIRRILEIMTTNRVENEDEVANLGELLRKANITSDDGKYEEILNVVISPSIELKYWKFWVTLTVDWLGVTQLHGNDSVLLVGGETRRMWKYFWNRSNWWRILLLF